MPQRRWPFFVVFAFLSLVEIAGVIVFCYKLEHPAAQQMFQTPQE